jgi:hypothetical protein
MTQVVTYPKYIFGEDIATIAQTIQIVRHIQIAQDIKRCNYTKNIQQQR